MTSTMQQNRRSFLGHVAAAAATVGLAPRWLAATARPGWHGQQGGPDAWLDALTGQHKQLFDMNAHEDGVGLLHIRNWYATYNGAYEVPDSQLNAVGTLYGGSTPLGFNDAMWEKYQLGRALNITDPHTSQPLTRNWFNHPADGDPFALGFFDSSMEALRARGTMFLLCNNAWTLWTQRLAQGMPGMTAGQVKEDMRANMLPGVTVVPAMVIAIGKAQERGVAYMKLG